MFMNLKTSTALALAALLSVAPAMAATYAAPAMAPAMTPAKPAAAAPAAATVADNAKVIDETKATVPIGTLVKMIGEWKKDDLAYLDKAKSIEIFDTKTLYHPADLKKIASAESSKSADLNKIRDAIKGDTGLMNWLDTNKIDLTRVVAVADPKGHAELFLY